MLASFVSDQAERSERSPSPLSPLPFSHFASLVGKIPTFAPVRFRAQSPRIPHPTLTCILEGS